MKKILTLCFLLGLVYMNGWGQASMTNYASTGHYTPNSGTFTPLSGSNEVTSIESDDAISSALPIGFDFYYMGTKYTNVYVSSNGFLSFNSNAGSANPNNLKSTSTDNRPLIAPLWDDLDGDAAGVASYLTTGTAPNRVFTFEWLNWEWNYQTNSATISFQVKLYENTGQIQFIYRNDSHSVNSASASVGLAASSTGNGNYVSLSSLGTAATTSTSTETSTISAKPSSSGQTYTFNPQGSTSPTNLTFTSITTSGMTLNWTDNSSDEGGFVLYISSDGINYTYNSTVAAHTGTGATSSAITGLSIGTTYYWKVYAIREALSSSAASNSQATLATVPGAPTIGTATAGNAQATVTFAAPASNGGAAITSYTVTSNPSGFTAIGSGSPLTVTGLANGTSYNFTVKATNSVGTGAASAVSNSVTPLGVAPTLTAASGATVDAPFNVTFIDNATWRAAITGITVNGTALSSTAYNTTTAGQITFNPANSTLLQTPGSKTIVVSATGYPTTSVTQSISVGVPFTLAITTQPGAPVTSGAVLGTQPVLTVKDKYNNLIPNISVIASVPNTQSGSWTLGGTVTVTTNTSGVASFSSLTATNATNPSIPFSANILFTSGTVTTTSSPFTIPGIAPALIAAPSATVDAPFSVTFTDNSPWRGAITGITVDGTALPAGAYSTTTAGKITFTPSASALLQSPGSKTIVVSATGYPIASVTQTIGVGIAAKLAITTQPTAPATNGGTLVTQPIVKITDQYGNATTSTASVTATVGSGVWIIGGTTSVSASGGTATFSGLTATTGSASSVTATITFTSGTLTTATSNSFVIPAANITTGTINGSPFCAGSSVSVPFTSNGSFISNSYTAQLSNSSGSFSSPINLSPSLVSNANSGTITATIPLSTAGGTGYRIRVISSSPAVNGSDNGSNLTINVPPSINSGGQPANKITCAGNPQTFTVSASGTSPSYQWQYSTNGTSGWVNVADGTPSNFTYANNTSSTLTVAPGITATANTYYYRCVVSNSCSSVNSNAANLTVNAKPIVSIAPVTSDICAAGSVSLTASGASTYQWSPSIGLSSTTAATVNASPSATTVYSVTGTSSAGCTALYAVSATVTVNSAPTAVTIIPANPAICAGAVQSLTATGGIGTTTAVTRNFNTSSTGFTAVNSSPGNFGGSGNTVNPDAAWQLQSNAYQYETGISGFFYNEYFFHSNDNSQFYLSNSDRQNLIFADYTLTTLTSSSIATTGYQTLDLNFNHNYLKGSSSNDSAMVQVSTDGTNFTTIAKYITSQGGSTFYYTYTDEDGVQHDVYNETFAAVTLNLNAYANKPNVYIRFKYEADYGYWWALDNVSVTGNNNSQVPITWSPTTPTNTLYTNSGATTSYVAGTNATTVYAKPSADITYIATATSSTGGCTTTGSTAVTVKPLPTASITVAPTAGSACAGASVAVNITGTAGASVNYSVNPGSATNPVTLPTPTVNSPTNQGDYTYTITSVLLNGCNGTPGSNATVHIYANPNAAITANSYVQIGGPVLTLTGATGGGTWSVDNTNLTLGNQSTGTIDATAQTPGTSNVTYKVTEAHDATTTCSTSVSKPVTITAQYVTKQNGNFSDFNTWNVGNQATGLQPSTSSTPTNNNSIEVQHALTLDANYTSGSYFAITGAGSMVIAPAHYFASSAGTINFNSKSVLIQSTSTGTGAIGQIAGTIAGATHVTVERYINGGDATNGKRAWRLITAPVTGVSINSAWQEGQVYNSTTGTNYTTGTINNATQPTKYGTLITSNLTVPGTANAAGYDFTGGSTSIKQYAPAGASGSWLPLADNQSGTNPQLGTLQDISVQPAYMLFVRGDRSIGATTTQSSFTTLRPLGFLRQGSQVIGTVHSTANVYEVAGNPYASAIDFSVVHSQNINLIKDQFAVWVSSLGTYGAYTYVASNGDGTYTATPFSMSGTIHVSPAGDRYIQSGEGFLVYPTGNGTGDITVDEDVKAPAQQASNITNTFRIVDTDRKLYVNLNQKSDTSATLADGFMVRFDPSYTSAIDEDDAQKPVNFNENLGILSHGSDLIVEARADVQKTDTVQLHLWNTTIRSYQLQIKGDNFASAAGLHAFLEDSYLKTKQEVSLSGSVTTVDFAVTSDAASYDHSRFRIVFQNDATVLPVTLTSVKAAPANGGVNVTWTVTGEVNMKRYTVERSIDGGTTYTTIATQEAKNNPAAALTNYNGFDALPKTGDNLYRIRMEANNGQVSYSSVVKVTMGGEGEGIQITLYPNPVRADGKVSLQLANLKAGTYLVSVYSSAGQTVYQMKIAIAQSNTTQSEELKLGSAPAQGSYPVRITDSKGTLIYTDKLVVGR